MKKVSRSCTCMCLFKWFETVQWWPLIQFQRHNNISSQPSIDLTQLLLIHTCKYHLRYKFCSRFVFFENRLDIRHSTNEQRMRDDNSKPDVPPVLFEWRFSERHVHFNEPNSFDLREKNFFSGWAHCVRKQSWPWPCMANVWMTRQKQSGMFPINRWTMTLAILALMIPNIRPTMNLKTQQLKIGMRAISRITKVPLYRKGREFSCFHCTLYMKRVSQRKDLNCIFNLTFINSNFIQNFRKHLKPIQIRGSEKVSLKQQKNSFFKRE